MNYTYQSFNFRGRGEVKPYYDLIANIATEEFGHIELVSATINALLTGGHQDGGAADVTGTPLGHGQDGTGNRHHFIATGLGPSAATPSATPGPATTCSSGNLILDLLHNFFLENARTNKLRVYEMTKDPCAREMLGYLFVRGGVHALAYAKARSSSPASR